MICMFIDLIIVKDIFCLSKICVLILDFFSLGLFELQYYSICLNGLNTRINWVFINHNWSDYWFSEYIPDSI